MSLSVKSCVRHPALHAVFLLPILLHHLTEKIVLIIITDALGLHVCCYIGGRFLDISQATVVEQYCHPNTFVARSLRPAGSKRAVSLMSA